MLHTMSSEPVGIAGGRAVGLHFLRPKPAPITPAITTAAEPGRVSQLELVLTSAKYGYTANAIEMDGEITVLRASRAVAKEFSHNQYGPLREQLIKDGRLKPT
jgi:hypothetical protein